MRLPIATDLSSRDGTVDQDAKLLNCFIEGDGVIKRPAVNSDLVDVTGIGQGGVAGNSLVFIINGDVLRSYNSSYVLQDTETL
jgi:hypothetical protein